MSEVINVKPAEELSDVDITVEIPEISSAVFDNGESIKQKNPGKESVKCVCGKVEIPLVEEQAETMETAAPEVSKPEAGQDASPLLSKRQAAEQASKLVNDFITSLATEYRGESLLVEIKKDEGVVKYQLTKLLYQMSMAGLTMPEDAVLKDIGKIALPVFTLPEFVNLYSYKTNQDVGLKPDHDAATTEPFIFDEMIDMHGIVSVHALMSDGEVITSLFTSQQREDRESFFLDAVSDEFMAALPAKELEYGLAPTAPKVVEAASSEVTSVTEDKPVAKKPKISPALKQAFDKANARKSHSS